MQYLGNNKIGNKINVYYGFGFHPSHEGFCDFHVEFRGSWYLMQFLNHNFEIVKQCLLKIKDIEANMGKEKENTSSI